MSLLNVTIVGNLGGDPELKFTPAGKAVCNFNVATTRTWNDAQGTKQTETTWVTITAWGKTAEICNQYLAKGRQVLVQGSRIKADSWIDKNSGEAKAKLVLTADKVVFLGGAKSGNGDSDSQVDPSESGDDMF